ncbi:MAG: hypothetical protein ACOCYW_04855 [Roseicyclus sp.]
MTTIPPTRTRGLRAFCALAALMALAACGAGPGPNDVSEGVGFSDYETYQARRAALAAPPAPVAPSGQVRTALPPADVAAEPFAADAAGQSWLPVDGGAPTRAAQTDVARLASAAIDEAERAAEGALPPASAPAEPAPGLPPITASGDDFEAPPLPEGIPVLGATVVAFALSTDNAVGERVHARFPLRLGRPEVRCSDFRTTDLAQDWFLTNDGPDRDRAGLDPDGDGFACNWDPERYRAEARAAAMPEASVPGASFTGG